MASVFETHGAFSWNELLTDDVPGAIEFYRRLFGWRMENLPDAPMPYAVVHAGSRAIGGIMTIPCQADGMPPTWCSYVTVDDVDALAARVPHMGGKLLVPPQDIPKVGRFAVIRDPQGAVLNVITYFRPA